MSQSKSTGGGGGTAISGTPADSQVAVWTDASTIEGTTGLTFIGADANVKKLGIGKAVPSYPIHIDTGTEDAFISIQSSTDKSLALGSTSTKGVFQCNQDFQIQTGGASRLNIGDAGDIGFYNTSAAVKMTWDATNSRLGIGTAGPSRPLHIVQTDTTTEAAIAIENSYVSGADASAWFKTVDGEWAIGIDQSNSKAFTFSQASVLGSNDRLTITTGGNVGIGVTDPDEQLEVAGRIHISSEVAAPSAPAAGNGGILYTKADGKPYWISDDVAETDLTSGGGGGSSPWTTSGTFIYRDSKVGIGTGDVVTSQSECLALAASSATTTLADMDGPDLTIRNTSNTDNNYGSVRFMAYGDSGSTTGINSAVVGITTDQTEGYGDLAFMTHNAADGLTQRMRIDKDGKVGIGRAPTSTALEVNGDILVTPDAGTASLTFSGAGAAVINQYANYDLTLKTNNTARMTIDNAGDCQWHNTSGAAKTAWDASEERLGIGTIAPSTALHVVGSITGDASSSYHKLTRLTGTHSTPGTVLELRNNTTGTTATSTFGSRLAMCATTTGTGGADNVNQLLFDVVWTDPNHNTRTSDISIQLMDSGTRAEQVRITGAGNVGIGVTDPDSELEINGQIKITGGSPGADKVLTSDADGLATWETAGGGGGGNLTTKGDLEVYTTSQTRLGVGDDDKVLTADSSAASGVAWKTAGAGSSLWTETGDDIYYDTGNVGVGSTPKATQSTWTSLTLGNNATISGQTSLGAEKNFYIAQNAYRSTAPSWKHISEDEASAYSQSDGGHNFFTAVSAAADATASFTNRLAILNSGNVGLGVGDPDEQLELLDGCIHLGQTTAPSPTADKLYNVSGTLYWNNIDITGATYWELNAPGDKIYYNTGNVGIGTDTPSTALHVAGEITLDTDNAIRWENSNTQIYGSGDSGSKYINFATDGEARLRISSDGAFGLGATPNYGTSGQVLTSAGDSAVPTWENAGGGSSFTVVTVTDMSTGYTSTATSDTLYKIDDSSYSEMSNAEFDLPSASSAGAGTRITVFFMDTGVMPNAQINADGDDLIYDAEKEYMISPEGMSAIETTKMYVSMTFLSDGDELWISEGNHGAWSEVSAGPP